MHYVIPLTYVKCLRRSLSALTAVIFTLTTALPPGYAQTLPAVPDLPVPGAMVLPSHPFVPPTLHGLSVYPQDPFRFDFIIDTGDDNLQGETLKAESARLIKYFLAALTVPEDELWVNLSPYEAGRVIPQALGQTEMGRDMLTQDYILKQLTASLMYPEKDLGSQFWKRVYERAQKELGTTEIPVDTFHKVWVVPDKAVVYEHEHSVFVVERHLKVMLDSDYATMQYASKMEEEEEKGEKGHPDQHPSSNLDFQSSIIKEIILPEIEREVNEGKHFAPLRQIYNSMILAAWYKKRLKESLLGKIYFDQNKIKGVDVADKDIKEKIYAQYLKAFTQGVYNYIKEDIDPGTKEIVPRKYFSGGLIPGVVTADSLEILRGDASSAVMKRVVTPESRGSHLRVSARLSESTAASSAIQANTVVPEPSLIMAHFEKTPMFGELVKTAEDRAAWQQFRDRTLNDPLRPLWIEVLGRLWKNDGAASVIPLFKIFQRSRKGYADLLTPEAYERSLLEHLNTSLLSTDTSARPPQAVTRIANKTDVTLHLTGPGMRSIRKFKNGVTLGDILVNLSDTATRESIFDLIQQAGIDRSRLDLTQTRVMALLNKGEAWFTPMAIIFRELGHKLQDNKRLQFKYRALALNSKSSNIIDVYFAAISEEFKIDVSFEDNAAVFVQGISELYYDVARNHYLTIYAPSRGSSPLERKAPTPDMALAQFEQTEGYKKGIRTDAAKTALWSAFKSRKLDDDLGQLWQDVLDLLWKTENLNAVAILFQIYQNAQTQHAKFQKYNIDAKVFEESLLKYIEANISDLSLIEPQRGKHTQALLPPLKMRLDDSSMRSIRTFDTGRMMLEDMTFNFRDPATQRHMTDILKQTGIDPSDLDLDSFRLVLLKKRGEFKFTPLAIIAEEKGKGLDFLDTHAEYVKHKVIALSANPQEMLDMYFSNLSDIEGRVIDFKPDTDITRFAENAELSSDPQGAVLTVEPLPVTAVPAREMRIPLGTDGVRYVAQLADNRTIGDVTVNTHDTEILRGLTVLLKKAGLDPSLFDLNSFRLIALQQPGEAWFTPIALAFGEKRKNYSSEGVVVAHKAVSFRKIDPQVLREYFNVKTIKSLQTFKFDPQKDLAGSMYEATLEYRPELVANTHWLTVYMDDTSSSSPVLQIQDFTKRYLRVHTVNPQYQSDILKMTAVIADMTDYERSADVIIDFFNHVTREILRTTGPAQEVTLDNVHHAVAKIVTAETVPAPFNSDKDGSQKNFQIAVNALFQTLFNNKKMPLEYFRDVTRHFKEATEGYVWKNRSRAFGRDFFEQTRFYEIYGAEGAEYDLEQKILFLTPEQYQELGETMNEFLKTPHSSIVLKTRTGEYVPYGTYDGAIGQNSIPSHTLVAGVLREELADDILESELDGPLGVGIDLSYVPTEDLKKRMHRPEIVSRTKKITSSPLESKRPVILVVDDDDSTRFINRLILKEAGFDILLAGDGNDALTQITAHPEIALVITDNHMPRMTGVELANELKNTHPDLPVIINTGDPVADIEAQVDKKNVRAVLEKDGNPDTVLNAVKQILGSTGSSPISDDTKGGIDLNFANWDLQIRYDANGVPLPLPLQPLDTIHIEGLTPVILNITPVHIPRLLGLKEKNEKALELSSTKQ